MNKLSKFYGSFLFLVLVYILSALTMAQETTEITNSIGMKLKLIPKGTPQIGSNQVDEQDLTDVAIRKVEIADSYFLGITEVTEHQWATVMESASSINERTIQDPENDQNSNVPRRDRIGKLGSNLPVSNISWYEASEFCRRLSELQEEKSANRVYRLPTEAEWEYACRAGSKGAYGFDEQVGSLDEHAWFFENSWNPRKNALKQSKKTTLPRLKELAKPTDEIERPHTHPVALKAPNAWGLYDMHGNVLEWCRDLLSDNSMIGSAISFGKVNAPDTFKYALRGGSYASEDMECRVDRRRYMAPHETSPEIGFRVAIALSPTSDALPVETNSIGQRLIGIPFTRDDQAINASKKIIFFMSETEVTQKQWLSIMPLDSLNKATVEGDNYPARGISFSKAMEFCRRLTAKPEEIAAGRVYRLPTEDEWEFASRAGMKTRYSFGDDDALLRFYSWADSHHEVRAKYPNLWGLYDVHGNVAEWSFSLAGVEKRLAKGGPNRSNTETFRRNTKAPEGFCIECSEKLEAENGHPHVGMRVICCGSFLIAQNRIQVNRRGGAGDKKVEAFSSAKNFINSQKMQMISIPEGQFNMGSDLETVRNWSLNSQMEKHFEIETPIHKVTITKPFFISDREVTVGQFRTFARSTNYKSESQRDGKGITGVTSEGDIAFNMPYDWENPGFPTLGNFTQTDDQPVVNVSWNDAMAYCQWLSKTENKVYRLPTEAEWEYACRCAAIENIDADLSGSVFHFGYMLQNVPFFMNVNDPPVYKSIFRDDTTVRFERNPDAYRFTSPTGSFLPNSLGIYDMHGNVSEWCLDWFDRYSSDDQIDPRGPSNGDQKIFRGGNWRISPAECRSATRYSTTPKARTQWTGFRVVCDL